MKHNKSSSELNKEYICKYNNPSLVKSNKIWGFKLVEDRNENFYSIGTGLYRYKIGKVKRKESDYSVLYKNTKYYRDYMVDKIAIFNSLSDIDKFYPNYKEDSKVCVLRICLGGNIISVEAKNKYTNCRVFAGSKIEKMERLC